MRKMQSNVLVLGGNGFIGSHLISKLLKAGHNVSVFDKYPELYRQPNNKVNYYYGEFGNRGLISEALVNIDIVYHLISTTTPKTSTDDPIFDVQTNVLETLFLLERCVKESVKKIVFISSGGAVYGNPGELPVSENSPMNPASSYGIVKLTIEKYLELYKKIFGLNYTIIRPSNPFGPRQNPNGIQGAISVFLGNILANKAIEIWGNGEIVRDYIYIDDLIEGIYKATFNNSENEIYNLGSGNGHSLNDIVAIIKKVVNKEVNVIYKESRVFDVDKIYLDITRAKQQLSWYPVVEIEDGIKKSWDFINSIEEKIRK